MTFSQKKNAAVFCLTSNLTFAVASVMLDIKKHCPALVDEFVIFHDGIKKRDQKLLNSILPTRFIRYEFPIKDLSIFSKEALKYFSYMLYAKYECFRLLDEYKKVLLLDYDIVITGDISELLEPCDSGIKILLSKDTSCAENLYNPQEISEYDLSLKSICASVFVLFDNLKDHSKLYEWCYEKTKKYAKNLRYPEQAILNFMIQEFALKPDVTSIDHDVYCCHPNELHHINSAKIIHSYGYPKFWNGYEGRFDSWHKNYRWWLDNGGSPYAERMSLTKKIRTKLAKIFGKK